MQKKSCFRKASKTNYCKVQFIEDPKDLTTPPDSPVEDNRMIEPSQMMYEHLYKKEKERAQLLETQIQHLQLKLMDRDQRLEQKNDTNIKYAKVCHLVNHISTLSSDISNHTTTKKECTSSLESISDHLQKVLFDLMVAHKQQRYDPNDDLFDTEPTGIYYY